MILILVALNFMLKADEIMKKIFKLEGGSSNVGDVASQSIKGAITGIAGASVAGKIAKGYISGVGRVAEGAATKAAELVGTAGLLGTKYKTAHKIDKEEGKAIKTTAMEEYRQAREAYAMSNHSKEDRQRFKSAKENYKSAKEESKKVIGRAIRVARSESGTHVERFKKNLKHQMQYVGKGLKSGTAIVTKRVNAILAIPFLAVDPKIGLTMIFNGVSGGGRLKRLNASIKGYKKALSKEQPPKEVMDKFISDYKKKNNGKEPSEDEINDFIKEYQDKQIKRYKLTYITSSILTLGLTDDLLEQAELIKKDKDLKKEGKKVKAGNEAICTARKAEMIINAKIQELKQNGNVTKQELKQKMKEAFQSNTPSDEETGPYAEIFEQVKTLRDSNDKIYEALGKSLYGNVDDFIDTIINL